MKTFLAAHLRRPIGRRRLLRGMGLAGVIGRLSPVGWISLATAQPRPSAQPTPLVGHWRRTRIVLEEPIDDHLNLGADGTLTVWQVKATSRSTPQVGRWRVTEGQLMLQVPGEAEGGAPYVIHEGRLVFPNIPNRRQFWERVA